MADYAVTGKYVNKGINDEGMVIVEHELAQALAASDTVTLTLPSGMENQRDLIPHSMSCWSNAEPRVRQANIAVTSHDTETGVTVLTASGVVADNSTITMLYLPSTIGS